MSNDASDQERQQRELEEIRRSFKEIGARMGSLFEPAQPNGNSEAAGRPQLEAPAKPLSPAAPDAPDTPDTPVTPARPSAPAPPAALEARTDPVVPSPVVPATMWERARANRVAVVIAVGCLLAGIGLGYLLPRASARDTSPPSVTAAVPTTLPAVPPRAVAPPACLETARRGDVVVDLLMRNIRDQRLTLAFKAYTEASQACRKEASP